MSDEDFKELIDRLEKLAKKVDRLESILDGSNPPIQLGMPMATRAPRSVGFRGTWHNPHVWPDPQA
jgi:hypothetical protein